MPTEIIALSGASGAVGQILRAELPQHGIDMRSAAWSKKLTPLTYGEDVMSVDLRDPRTVDRLLDGVSVLFHLAGASDEAPLESLIENNLRALHEIYEGAFRHRVRRVGFASSIARLECTLLRRNSQEAQRTDPPAYTA